MTDMDKEARGYRVYIWTEEEGWERTSTHYDYQEAREAAHELIESLPDCTVRLDGVMGIWGPA